jgi:hypothetical protein
MVRYTVEIKFNDDSFRTVLDESPDRYRHERVMALWGQKLTQPGSPVHSVTEILDMPTVKVIRVSVAERKDV